MDNTDHLARERPLLIYDGDCGFCRYSVDYARDATGDTVRYRPFQALGDAFAQFTTQDYREAIRLVETDGRTHSGAGAAFRALELGGHLVFWARLYRALPLFAAACEWTYRLVARHRGAAHALCRGLFGPQLRPARYQLTTWLFLRLLALIYLAAFGSLAWQTAGLIGSEGILPAEDFFAAVDARYGPSKYALLPSLLWLDASTASIQALGIAGCVLSALLLCNRGTTWVLPLLYLCYLSLYHGGQRFTSYQWDILLLECGFLAIFLPHSPTLFTWLYRWLLFRFLLQSGLVKWWSGDPHWRDFSALDFHFETQPLPNVLAWYAHQLPEVILCAGVAFTFAVELVAPFLLLLPRRPRQVAALLVALFQLAIMLSGSYNFFNLLTLCLCVLLLDDQCLQRIPLRGLRGGIARRSARAGPVIGVIALLYLTLSTLWLGATANRLPLGEWSRALAYWSSPWHIANGYGLFAIMTTERLEIIFEGSRDGRQWRAYELPYKPGDTQRAPGWATPRQPRLDWQLWFAALQRPDDNPWVGAVMTGLLRGAPPVLGLFAHNPFPDEPPRYLRASLYRYRFTTFAERQEDSAWWHREYLGEYWPVTAWQLPLERRP